MPTQIVKPRLWTPSLKSGYARHAGESLNPGLWQWTDAWVPALGPSFNDGVRNTLRPQHGFTGNRPWVNNRGHKYGNPGGGDAVVSTDYEWGRGGVTESYSTVVSGLIIGSTMDANETIFKISPNATPAADECCSLRFSSATNIELRCRNDVDAIIINRNTTISDTLLNNTFSIGLSVNASTYSYFVRSGEATIIDVTGVARSAGTLSNLTQQILLSSFSTRTHEFLTGAVYLTNKSVSDSVLHKMVLDPLAPFRLRPLSVAFPSAAAPAGLAAYRRVMSVF